VVPNSILDGFPFIHGTRPTGLCGTNVRLGAGAEAWKNRPRVSDNEQIFDPALRAANLALSGRKRREVSRIASIELRFTDARSGAWEALAMVSVGVATVLCVIGVWFL
jgi:hypothetical protein